MGKLKPFLLPSALIVSFILLHQFLFLYEDDFYYALLAGSDFRSFLAFHITHFQLSNGSVLVHIFSTALLYFDVYLWRVINPFLLFGTIFFATKCVSFTL